MAKAYGRTVSGMWWLFGFLCALLFRISGTYAQAQAEYGVRREPSPPVPAGARAAPTAPMPRRDWRVVNPNDRADAERLLKRLSEPVKAVEPTAKESEESKALLEKMLKSAAESESAAKAGKTEDAQKSNRDRLEAFQDLVKLGPSALGMLRDRRGEATKDATLSEFVRSQVSQSIRRIESDARSGLEEKIGRLGQGALDALSTFEQKAAEDMREARDRVGSLERELSSAGEAEKDRIRRELAAARDSRDDAIALQATLRSIRAKAAAVVAKNPPPAIRPPDWDRPQPAYGVQVRYGGGVRPR